MKEITLCFLAVFFLAIAKTDDSIKLPSGTVVKTAIFAIQPKWKEWFPPDNAFFAEKYAEGNLKGMHSRYSGRLDGPSVTLHENGNIKMLAFYPEGQRQGAFRLWDEDKNLVLYSKYQDNKNDGITCLFKDGAPWLIQEWNKGNLQSETLVVRKGSDFVAVDDAKQLDVAQKRLSTVEKELTDTESDLKKSMGKWFADEKDRIKKEKDKILMPVAQAQYKAREQAIRQEADARAAAAHPYRKSGRVADADEGMATRDLKAASKNTKSVTGGAKHELSEMDKEITEHYKELYHFAMTALEKSPQDEHVSSPSENTKKKSRLNK
ncbi:MAG: hypothetical protein ABSA77_06425 [Thermoguttaceae bacterium]